MMSICVAFQLIFLVTNHEIRRMAHSINEDRDLVILEEMR